MLELRVGDGSYPARTIEFSELKMVVLDEADEMLRMGFIDDVEWILSHTPKSRQTALFSATMPREIRRIAEQHIQNAVQIEIERKTLTVPAIKQFYINVSESQKADVLTRILEAESTDEESVIVFHRTKMGCEQLADKLRARGYSVEAMHGDVSQNQREAVVKKLKSGKVEIVVATDVAARGLDVERIGIVVNYDMPGDTESYVHRIGRTGRAGRTGKSIVFVTPRQLKMKREIERYTNQQIEPMKLPTKADVVARRILSLKRKDHSVLTEHELDLYLSLVEDFAEENGCDIAEIAAAAIFLAVGDKPWLSRTIEINKFNYPEEGMVKLFFNVGRKHRVSPADFVGAIANEAGIPGKAIGAIDMHDRFTLVDVPKEFVSQVLSKMKDSQIRNQSANIRLATEAKTDTENFSRPQRKGREFREDRRKRKKNRVKHPPTEASYRKNSGKRKNKRSRR